jgi:hypothetical protein
MAAAYIAAAGLPNGEPPSSSSSSPSAAPSPAASEWRPIAGGNPQQQHHSTSEASAAPAPAPSASDWQNGPAGGSEHATSEDWYVTVPTDGGGDALIPKDEIKYAPAPAPALSHTEESTYVEQARVEASQAARRAGAVLLRV